MARLMRSSQVNRRALPDIPAAERYCVVCHRRLMTNAMPKSLSGQRLTLQVTPRLMPTVQYIPQELRSTLR